MGIFNRFPWSEEHQLNLDWILRSLKDLLTRVKALEDSGGGGGGGTTDYLDLDNKPQINSVTLTGNKTAAQLDLGTYSKPIGGIPATDLANAVQTSLGKADSAFQVVNQHSNIITANLMTLDTKENIYPGAADWSGTWDSNDLSANTFDGSTFHGYPVLTCTGSWKRSLYKILNAEAGKTYTFGCWVKAADASDIRLNSKYSGLTAVVSSQTVVAANVQNNSWTWVQFTFDCTGSGTFAPYIATSKNTTLYIAGYVLVEGDNIFSNKIFHCEKNGTGDFSSFVDAVNEAIKYRDSIVFIGAGEWDIISEFGSTYMANVSSSSSTWGLVLKNNIHIIGTPQTVIKAVNVSGSPNFNNIKQYFSIFNAGGDGGFTIENLTLYDENLRYSVHDDFASDSTPYSNKYINCSMIHKTGMYPDCIGGGIGENCTIEIRGCYFEGDNGRPRLAYYHGNNNISVINAQAKIVVYDNYFAQDGTFQLMNYGNSTTVSKAYVNNNSFGTAPAVTDGSYPSPIIVNMELVEWENEIRTGGGGTSDYNDLSNKPQIGGVTLSGNKTASQLGLQTDSITDEGGYFPTDTVEDALQAIGAEIAGINTLIGTGVIT